ncbi:unnamed protein product [Rhodiola kirilowii]
MSLFYSFLFLTWLSTALFIRYLITTYLKSGSNSDRRHRPPPSPPALPIIGHIHHLLSAMAKSLQTLSNRYGPIMEIKVGAAICYVASDSSVAKQIFKTQELNFSSRPEFGSAEYFKYRGSRFVMAQYGDYWRFMKKLCMTKLLSVPQLQTFIHVREDEVDKLLHSLIEKSKSGEPADLSSELTSLTNNVICQMVMGKRCSGTSNEAATIKHLVEQSLVLAGKLTVGDSLGFLKRFFGYRKLLESVLERYDTLVEMILKEHEKEMESEDDYKHKGNKDLMHILLDTHRDPAAEVKITRVDIKSFLLDLFMAGTDTSSTAMQWAMGELINHPYALSKLKTEIESVVGTGRLMNESDVPNLPYLRAVLRETLRLHPSAPLIIRECAEDCQINGYDLKAKTRMLVNVFAVMRDPKEWKDPDEFVPERFMEESSEKIGEHQMEFKGQNFRYLPFGSGRRGCPGASLAMNIMHLTIGRLVQCFDFEVSGGGGKVDMTLGNAFAAEMANPLIVFPRARKDLFSSTLEFDMRKE